MNNAIPFILTKKPINKLDIKPARTSYASMSSWFFIDDAEKKVPAANADNSMFMSDDVANPDNAFIQSTLFGEAQSVPDPDINSNRQKSRVAKLPNIRPQTGKPSSAAIKDYLMKSWRFRSDESNKCPIEIKNADRKGRSGAGGAWSTVTEAHRNNGNRLLFINGPTYQEADSRLNTPQTFVGATRNVPSVMIRKEQDERLGVQTRNGVENGNWNCIR